MAQALIDVHAALEQYTAMQFLQSSRRDTALFQVKSLLCCIPNTLQLLLDAARLAPLLQVQSRQKYTLDKMHSMPEPAGRRCDRCQMPSQMRLLASSFQQD